MLRLSNGCRKTSRWHSNGIPHAAWPTSSVLALALLVLIRNNTQSTSKPMLHAWFQSFAVQTPAPWNRAASKRLFTPAGSLGRNALGCDGQPVLGHGPLLSLPFMGENSRWIAYIVGPGRVRRPFLTAALLTMPFSSVPNRLRRPGCNWTGLASSCTNTFYVTQQKRTSSGPWRFSQNSANNRSPGIWSDSCVLNTLQRRRWVKRVRVSDCRTHFITKAWTDTAASRTRWVANRVVPKE